MRRRLRFSARRPTGVTSQAFTPATTVGSTLTCSFCHTGTQALVRNLGPAEIVAGAGHFLQEEAGEEIADRIVRFLAETG